jgi:hypothetical protein
MYSADGAMLDSTAADLQGLEREAGALVALVVQTGVPVASIVQPGAAVVAFPLVILFGAAVVGDLDGFAGCGAHAVVSPVSVCMRARHPSCHVRDPGL